MAALHNAELPLVLLQQKLRPDPEIIPFSQERLVLQGSFYLLDQPHYFSHQSSSLVPKICTVCQTKLVLDIVNWCFVGFDGSDSHVHWLLDGQVDEKSVFLFTGATACEGGDRLYSYSWSACDAI